MNTTKSPLEGFFDIEEGSTESVVDLELSKELAIIEANTDQTAEEQTPEEVIKEDELLRTQFGTVYNYALSTFESQSETLANINPAHVPRTAEVAAQFLKIALDATLERAKVHGLNKKLSKDGTKKTETTNNNLIVADRNDILRMMKGET